MWFVFKAMGNPGYLMLASVVGDLTYSIRTNGLFVLPIILFSFFLLRKKVSGFSYKHLIYCTVLFLVVIAPLMYQRQVHFGSPFNFGDAGKYWVDDVSEMYTNLPAPTFIEYLKTHSLADYFNRFIIGGLFKLLGYFGYFLLSPFIVLFFVYGIMRFGCSKQFIPLTTAILIFMLGFIPFYKLVATDFPEVTSDRLK